MTIPTSKFTWTEKSPGDEYILNERSYDCLFRSETSLQAKDRWLDLGAHVGYFSVRIANQVGVVIAVEPEPMNVKHLRENLALNWANNVTVVPVAAVAGSEKTVELGLGRTFTYTHKVGHTRGRQHIEVPARNVNDLVHDFEINKIKMDVEGLEFNLLSQLDFGTIEEIILEWHFTLIPDPTWEKLRLALEWFQQEGFRILRAPAELAKPTKRWTAIIWAKRP